MAISANSKTRKTESRGPFVAPECGRISQTTRLKTEVSLLARECFIKFNLMVSTDCEPTSASHAFGVLLNHRGATHVEHFGESRFRILRGLGLSCRFICATRRLGGSGKWANHDNRSQRSGEMLPG
jgi:hypothetical protein